MGLVARHIEASGIPTIIIGSARDVIEHCGVPRFLFTDFPLGNSCGRPYDEKMQRDIIDQALCLLEQATAPRTTVQSPAVWGDDHSWRSNFLAVTDENREALRRAGETRKVKRAADKATNRIR